MKRSTSSLLVLGLLLAAPTLQAATSAPVIDPVLPRTCVATFVVTEIDVTELEFSPEPGEEIADAFRRQLLAGDIDPDDPIVRIECSDGLAAGTRRVHFGVQIDSVNTTPILGASDGSGMPSLPQVGGTATGTLD